ncbi:MAG TPA: arylsulfotransferase family protein [Solirubrobacteraceae bacterium]|nr:arylsulfotransferase family protein [Solirubrobacteraceae bacterium]
MPGAAPAATRTAALHVIPFPGTPDASAVSQVIFSSLARSELRSVAVTGSRSGVHAGALSTLPDGAGTAFTPAHPFTAGEVVRVRATLRSPTAGTTLGDPGATQISFVFTIGRQASVASAVPAGPRAQAARRGPVQHYRSEPHLHPPAVTASSNPDTGSGDIFLTPRHSSQQGPMILDSQGHLVWFHRVAGMAYNLEVQQYRGHPVLTWWQGGGSHPGEDVIAGRSYHVMRVLHAANGYTADVHEFQITRQGTAIIDCVVPVQANLTSVGGASNGVVQDNVIQELDIRTGRLLWEWHSLGHIPISDSYRKPPSGSQPYSYFHMNAIQQLPDGNLLVSGSATWAAYKISRRTGRVIWALGGKHSSFRMNRKARFEWQHDPHLLPGNILSVFDDAASPQEEAQSSAKVLRLHMKTMTATLLRRYKHKPPLLATHAGSVQILPNHDVFVGWGSRGIFSEYTRPGQQIFHVKFAVGIYSYRAYRFPWHARPQKGPSLAIVRHAGQTTLYVSWNGATQVASWKVLGGPRPGHLQRVETVPKTGFETTIRLTSAPPYVQLEALNSSGHGLARSRAESTGH